MYRLRVHGGRHGEVPTRVGVDGWLQWHVSESRTLEDGHGWQKLDGREKLYVDQPVVFQWPDPAVQEKVVVQMTRWRVCADSVELAESVRAVCHELLVQEGESHFHRFHDLTLHQQLRASVHVPDVDPVRLFVEPLVLLVAIDALDALVQRIEKRLSRPGS